MADDIDYGDNPSGVVGHHPKTVEDMIAAYDDLRRPRWIVPTEAFMADVCRRIIALEARRG